MVVTMVVTAVCDRRAPKTQRFPSMRCAHSTAIGCSLPPGRIFSVDSGRVVVQRFVTRKVAQAQLFGWSAPPAAAPFGPLTPSPPPRRRRRQLQLDDLPPLFSLGANLQSGHRR